MIMHAMMMMMMVQGVSKGRTPLVWACFHGNKHAVKLLLTSGASVADVDHQVGLDLMYTHRWTKSLCICLSLMY